MTQTNSFPLLEIALSLYNHHDKMIQSVVKNILLIILKLKYPPLIEYLCSLPSLVYFTFICCRIKGLLLLISKEDNYEQYKVLQEDIVDEIMFIQDIFCLNIDKINHILINSLFNYCILPYIINMKYEKIKLNIKLYFINVLFTAVQDECFLNILFTLLFFPSHIVPINTFIKNPPLDPDNYFYDWSENNNNIQLSSQSFINYIKYNFNNKFLQYIISTENKKFNELTNIIKKYKDKSSNHKETIQKELNYDILNLFSLEEKKQLLNYHEALSTGTGINCGINTLQKENECNKSFKNIIEKLYVIFYDKSLELKSKLIDNNIKEYLFSLINIKQNNIYNILFMICILFRNILIINNCKISKLLLKQAKVINGNNLNDKEINNIIKENANKNLSNNILMNEEFQEMEDDEYEDDNYNKIIENMEKKKQMTPKENEIIEKSVLINKNCEFTNFNEKYFSNIDKISSNILKNKKDINDNIYYYDINLIDTFIELLNIKNNLKPIIFKCISDIIISLITKNKDNKNICFAPPQIKSKIQNIYKDFKQCIINNYKNNQNFHLYAYTKFQNQYKIFLSLVNFDYDKIIKEGYIILNNKLLNFNFEKIKEFENIIFDKNYKSEEERRKEILNNNIINFYIIHDFYYIISNEENVNIEKDLFINYYPLKFDELINNKQYFLCDLNTNIKYFSCKCKINKNNNQSNSYLDSTLLLYENYLYVGNSSSNPNYTRIIDKYSISNCSVESNSSIPNCVDLYIIGDDHYIEIEVIFANYELFNKMKNIMNEEIKLSRQREKQKFKEFLYKLK